MKLTNVERRFTEAQLEQAIIDLLKEEGHEHVHGKTINRDLTEVLLKEDLKSQEATFNSPKPSPNITSNCIRQPLEVLL